MGDDFLDRIEIPDLAWAPLGISGFCFGWLMSEGQWDLVLFTAIIIGVVVSGKVTHVQFGIGFVLIGLLLMFRGIPEIVDILEWMAVLIMLLLSAILDERGNDWVDRRRNPTAQTFFQYRFTLKLVALLLSIAWPDFFFVALGLWMFDFGYEISGLITEQRLNQDEYGQDYNTHP